MQAGVVSKMSCLAMEVLSNGGFSIAEVTEDAVFIVSNGIFER